MRIREKIELSDEQRRELECIVKKGKHKSSEINHANILLDLDEKQADRYTQEQIAARNHVCVATVVEVSRRFITGGIESALRRKKRETPPVAPKFIGEAEARIVKLACSAPPEGRTRWTLQLLADEAVRLEIVESASDNGIRLLLKKHNLSLT